MARTRLKPSALFHRWPSFFFLGLSLRLLSWQPKTGPDVSTLEQLLILWFCPAVVIGGAYRNLGFPPPPPPPPDQRATVKACLDDHSAGLRAFFWVFMLLWVVRTLTQLVECGGHIVQYGDSPVSRDIVLCLWYKEKKKKIHVVMMRCNNFFFFSKDLKRPCVGLWNSLVSRESDASPWCY